MTYNCAWRHVTQADHVVMRLAQELRRHAVLAWRRVATGERRTAYTLLMHGFFFRSEPSFVEGRKPDFLTFGRGRMWVEVKELDPPVSQASIGSAWEELSRRFAKFAGKCSIDSWISAGFNSRIAKQATHLVSLEIKAGLQPGRDLYLAIPSGNVVAGIVRIEWNQAGGTTALLVSPKSADGTYECPPAAQPADWLADVSITDGGNTRRLPAFRVLEEGRPACLLLHIDRARGNTVLKGVGNSEVGNVTTVERIRSRIDDANEQFKSGQAHRPLPALLVVYFDHLGGGQRSDILRACLGDLTYSIDVDSKKITDARYGANGVFRPDRNTAVSAIVYRSRHYPTVTFVNPFAQYPINLGWLARPVSYVDADGNIQPQ